MKARTQPKNKLHRDVIVSIGFGFFALLWLVAKITNFANLGENADVWGGLGLAAYAIACAAYYFFSNKNS